MQPSPVAVTVHTIVAVCVICQVCGYGAPPIFGQYKLNVKEIGACQSVGTNEYLMTSTCDVPNCGGKVSCTGKLELKQDFDDSVSVMYSVDMWETDGWKRVQNINITRGCSDSNLLVPEFFNLFINPGNESSRPCPLLKGNYSFHDVDLSEVRLRRFSELPYNRYKSVLEVHRDKGLAGCVVFLVDVHPRERS